MDEDTKYQLFEQVVSDECYEYECEYYHEDYFNGRHEGTCTGNMELCPVVADWIDTLRDYPEQGDEL